MVGVFVMSLGLIFITMGAASHEAQVTEHPERDPKAAENAMKEEGMFHLATMLKMVETAGE